METSPPGAMAAAAMGHGGAWLEFMKPDITYLSSGGKQNDIFFFMRLIYGAATLFEAS